MRKRIVQAAGVAFAVLLLLLYAPTAWVEFGTPGTIGWQLDDDARVATLAPDGSAERAGVRVGDRVDRTALPLGVGYLIANGRMPVGLVRDYRITSGTRMTTVRLTATAAPRASRLDALLQTGSFLVTAVYLIVAAAMIVLRPGPMSWWLLLYAGGTGSAYELSAVYGRLPPGALAVFTVTVFALIGGASAYPIVPFVLRFPYDRVEGTRRVLYLASVALNVIAALGFIAYYICGSLGKLAYNSNVLAVAQNAPILLAIAALAYVYMAAHERERQRLKWAIFGMGFGFLAYGASSWASFFSDGLTLSNALELLTIVMPLSLAYAVLRHRLLDFSFAVNRAIVYSATTTSVVAIVTGIDRLSGWLLSQFHVALFFDALATVGLGIVMGRIHRVLEGLVERVLFRKRSQAERHLRRIGGAMAYASTPHAVDEMLAKEPVETLELAAGAVFRLERSVGAFVRAASLGWADDRADSIDLDDPLVLMLQNEQNAVDLADSRWHHPNLPHGPLAPTVAVPIRFRREVTAFALFSPHTNGTEIDPDEIALLMLMADSAGSAYGLALAAASLNRVLELETQVAGLRQARA